VEIHDIQKELGRSFNGKAQLKRKPIRCKTEVWFNQNLVEEEFTETPGWETELKTNVVTS